MDRRYWEQEYRGTGIKNKGIIHAGSRNTMSVAGQDTDIQNAGQEFVRNALAEKIRGGLSG